jgi:thioredoxin-dependent peroxiredoxin
MIKEGDPLPDFDLAADDGTRVKLSDLRGKKVILYFYPKDDTPGCTQQACELRDHVKEIDEKGAVVLGVSPDSVASHRKFKEKFNLNFKLLSDEGHKLADALGVWQEKTLYGKKYWGNARTTFIIDEEGRVAKVLENVKPAAHAGQVLEIV